MNDVYASEYLCLFIIFMVRMIFMPVKNPNNTSCIDFFRTDTIKGFQETQVIETGLSDFHKLVVTVLQTIFPKSPPKITAYRNYQNYSNNLLRDDLNSLLTKENMILGFTSFISFTIIFIKNIHNAPMKKKHVLAKHANLLTKHLRKSIMLRPRLCKILLNEKSLESKKASKKKRNLLKKLRKLAWLKKLRKNAFKALSYKILLATASFGQLSARFLATN